MRLPTGRVAWCTSPYFVFRSRRGSTSVCTLRASMETPLSVASSRVQRLTENNADKEDGKCVVYWMNSAVRESYNHSLEMAASCASNRKLPLLALYVLDVKYPDWSERHFQFAGEGLRDVHTKLADRGVPLAILQVEEKDAKKLGAVVADVASRAGATRVIADAPLPLHRDRAWVEGAVRGCEKHGIPVVQVETNVVVPVREVTDKSEYAARTIRPKIHCKWDQYFTRLPRSKVLKATKQWPQEALEAHEEWDCETESLPNICRRASEVTKYFIGGYNSAVVIMNDFIDNKLVHYAEGRNEPSDKYQSQLSPYLRYGHISPVEIALKVRAKKGGGSAMRAGIDSFIEEMVVRRELAYNMCTFEDNYDTMKVLPNYAQITLREHAKDKREWIYTYEQLEAANTHDPYWNAAQLELLCTGKMQGYMRMYWSKKLIEWTDEPKKAFEWGIKLNNVYNLDGSDPNSYAGVAWCLGKHDQGWREREIFGKVRYMNDAGLKRKFNMQKYVDYADRLAKKSLPEEIAKVRRTMPSKRKQATISDMQSSAKKKKRLSKTS